MADRRSVESDAILRVFQSRDQTRAYYNKISKAYDLLAEHSEGPVRDQAVALLDAKPGERVLEIGAGTGHCVAALARDVGGDGKVYAIDLSEGMLQQTRERLEREELIARVDLRRADAAKLPFEPHSMDALFTSFTLELFDTPEIPVVLGECRRVLRPGGRIVVAGMSKGEPGDPLVKVYEWTHAHFPNFVDCRPIHVRASLEEAGFVIDDAQTVHMWVPVEIVLAHVRPRD